MKYFKKIALIPALILLVSSNLHAGNHEDDSNVMTQREMHRVLFEEFLEGKKCVYSQDKSKVLEVFIFDRVAKGVEAKSLELPQNTENVAGLFEQLVIRGKDLNRVKVLLGFGGNSKQLKIIATTADQLVLQMVKISLAEIKNKSLVEDDRGSESPPLVLSIEGLNEFSIEQISLRTTKDLDVDYAAYKKRLLKLQSNMVGKLRKELYWSTANKSFIELSELLSDPSEAFDRLVYPRTMASTAMRSHQLRGIVADPRVAKIYENLLQMENGESANVASVMFDGALQEFITSWQTAGALPNSAVYSVNAHLFLCSEFCSSAEVLNKMDAWEAWHAERSSDPSQVQFKYSARLEQAYSMNLQMNLIRRDRGLTIDELNAWVAVKLGPSLWGPPSSDPSFGKGGNKPPTLRLLDMSTSDSTPHAATLLVRVPDIEFLSAIDNPIRKEALQKILRDELMDITRGEE